MASKTTRALLITFIAIACSWGCDSGADTPDSGVIITDSGIPRGDAGAEDAGAEDAGAADAGALIDSGAMLDCDSDAPNTTAAAATRIGDGETIEGIVCGAGAMDFYVFNLSAERFLATLTFDSGAGELDFFYVWIDGEYVLTDGTDDVGGSVLDVNPGPSAVGVDYILRVDSVSGDAIPYTITLEL